MEQVTPPLELVFDGPFELWPISSDKWPLKEVASGQGIYLFTIEVQDQYRILYVGEADDVANRLRQHIRYYLSGRYWLYEAEALKQGKLVKTWKPTQDSEVALANFPQLQAALMATLPLIRLFVCRTATDKSSRWRIESDLISALRHSKAASAFLENSRVSVAPGKDCQQVAIRCNSALFELPSTLSL